MLTAIKRAKWRLEHRLRSPRRGASAGYQRVDPAQLTAQPLDGWRHDDVARAQDAAWMQLVENMMRGDVRADLLAAASALRDTGATHPAVLEVGCGSGYYAQILPHRLGRPVNYTGLDYAAKMIDIARGRYPQHPFHVGDACELPFADRSYDVVISGGSLMHIPDWRRALSELRRVSRRFVILHSVPIVLRKPTATLTKLAYGQPTAEIVFNRGELVAELTKRDLMVRQDYPSLDYDLRHVIGEPTTLRTWLCEVARP